ncbi:MAG: PIN domain-containing protein, partial [Mycobacterium sp.]
MPSRTFLDTNVLVYAVDNADPAKKQTARALLTETADVVMSAQVLGEFYVTITRKLQPAVALHTATEMVRLLARLACVPIDSQLVQLAIDAGQRWQLSLWDALVV